MNTHTRIGVGAMLLAACLAASANAQDDLRLKYLGRYDTQSTYHDHLMGVEQVGDHYALVCSYLDIVVVDLEALPEGGTQTYLDRLAGLDVTNTVTRPDGWVYANLRMGGLAVVYFDATTQSLSHVRTISEPDVYYEKIALAGDRLYVPAHSYGLRIFSLADPSDPQLLGSLETGLDDAWAVAVDGNLAYVADGAGGLKVLDVTDPTVPVIVAGETPQTFTGTAEDVLLHEGHVFVAAGGAGIAVYEPGDPATRTNYETPGMARELTMVGSYLAVADAGGVEVFSIGAGGSLAPVAREYGKRRSAGGSAVTLRIWYGVDAWGADRLLAANWDSMDVYQLVPPALEDQPDIIAAPSRIRFAPAGGTATIRITSNGCGPLTISNVWADSAAFSVSPQSAVLEPGEQLDLLVEYNGGQPGGGLIFIESDDPDESPLPIEVFGDTEFLDPGEPAIPFSLESWTIDHRTREYDHGQFDLTECAGRVVFFQIFGLGCPACTPAIADLENSVVGAYENDARVITAIVSQFTPEAKLETFWRNLYLRGQMLYDPDSTVGHVWYQQPYGGVPFSRGWVIGPDQDVVMPLFGYNPHVIRDIIDGLLEDMAVPGDADGDGVVDITDFLIVLGSWGPCPDPCPPSCPADFDDDCEVGIGDLLIVLGNWTLP